MAYTLDELEGMVERHNEVEDLARSYFRMRYDADPEWQKDGYGEPWYYRPSIDSIEIGTSVSIRCSARACGRGCCGTSHRTYNFPLSEICRDEDEVLAEIQARVEAEVRAKAEQEEQERLEQERQQEAAERQRLAELKAKYEGEGT